MKSITFNTGNTGEFNEKKSSAWLMAFIMFAQTVGALNF